MNIWAWTHTAVRELEERGEHRLASIIRSLPSAVVASRIDEAEALAAEGIALARANHNVWVEVFLGHWVTQCRLFDKQDVGRGLANVVALFELANRPEARDCPQSICVTQDLCIAYGLLDGPGYGEERLAASAETLGRINPNWQCFGCIASEHGSALEDMFRWSEAEQFYRHQIAALATVGARNEHLHSGLARCLMNLGRLDEAQSVLVALRRETANSTNAAQIRQLLYCELLAMQGRVFKARDLLPDPKELLVSRYLAWADAVLAIAKQSLDLVPVDIEAVFSDFEQGLAKGGSIWCRAQLAAVAAELALMRQDHAHAKAHVEQLRTQMPALRRPQFFRRYLQSLSALSAAFPDLLASTDAD